VVKTGHMTDTPAFDREVEHSKFRSDVEAVRAYGIAHPDDYVEELFENDPYTRLIVLMVGEDLQSHETALRKLVHHPNQLEVRRTAYSRSRLKAIQADVNEMATEANRGAFMMRAIVRGRLEIQLEADQEMFAARLHQRYRDAVALKVGVFPYPPTTEALDQGDRILASPPSPLPLLSEDEFDVGLENAAVVSSGGRLGSSLLLHNRGNAEAVVETNGGVTARVIDPASGERVGGFVGFQTAPLVTFRIPPGGSVSIPLLIGTTSTVKSLGYTIPPGRWAIEIPIQLEGRGRFRTPRLPILITAAQDDAAHRA
jgi:hypothetical protein